MTKFAHSSIKHLVLIIVVLGALSALSAVPAFATPEYARQTGFECKECHVDQIGGGALTKRGEQFLLELKSKGQYRSLSLAQHLIRLTIGYLHMLAAIIWFGTIMYVHVLLKPAYASKGLPKGELRLGWISMLVILATGVLLTVARVPSPGMLFTTRFGILLSIKIFLYLIMLSSAVIVTIFIGPKLRSPKTLASPLQDGACTSEGLCQYDGKDGRPAYVAYKGIIYDVTKSKLWRNGSHVTKHNAGRDLTDLLKNAPHGEDKILLQPQVGTLLATGEKIEQPFHLRLFYFFAYMNLFLVFVITFIIALMRWW
jgi:predicted heme/steroid binding protein